MLEMTADDTAVDTLALTNELFDRVAKLLHLKVPRSQIAAATGVALTQLDEIAMMPQVLERVGVITTQKIEEDEMVNKGWDGVEEEAIGTVLDHLKENPDADFALKAAAVANKAQRRGSVNGTIAGKTDGTAVIELNIAFIDKLQSMAQGMDAINANAKRVDTLDVSQTQNLFKDVSDINVSEVLGAVEEAEIVEELAFDEAEFEAQLNGTSETKGATEDGTSAPLSFK